MPTATTIQNALKQISTQSSFFSTLLNQTLGWPVADAQKIEDISYSWSADDLHAAELERDLVDGIVWQIQPLEQAQPWGIFVLEFKNAKLFTAGRGMASVLRKILRGLVSSRRKQAGLPSWKRGHLLFICTQGWQQFRFAYFRSKPEDPRSSRLTTFGWEPGSSNRTVCEFNLPALVWPDDSTKADKWIADWAKAFDKERLTNDFFRRFDLALDLIKNDLQQFQKLKSEEAYTQSQLLLERLIFLYFLQNRGWLKQDNRHLPSALQEHLKKPESFSYYGDFLERVFWSLSTPPLSSADRDHGLPFLNGGLFDDDEFDPSERRKKTSPPLKIRNSTLGKVFRDLLEAFNFTVTEDTPLNQEVAVDPEMLGKVFESIVLHAEQADPDATAPDKRKATGSYYTPRIVVHFICQEVLYQYLKNHLSGDDWGSRLRGLLGIDASDGIDETEREALKKIITPGQAAAALKLVIPLRCCDPAVGSGAFPVGLLHELVNLRRVLQTAVNGYVDPVRKQGSSWLQTTKQEIVQNCLFGVDIQQQAIEICRLRLWLSLVVDYDLGLDPFKADKSEFNRAIDGISQLPNLEMNFHRGDSLHDHISGVPIVIVPEKASRYTDEFAKIAKLGEQLHEAKRAERKRKLRVQILEKRLDLSRRILEEEIKYLDRDESSLDKLFHDETDSSSTKRKRISQEKLRLEEALGRIEKDRKEVEKLSRREFDGQFYVKLRKLEGADFDSPFNFAWCVDFPGIFTGNGTVKSGFDIIVGNPPFVTARNPSKRELWRERWPLVCHQKYQMLAPFFECSFGLLRSGGELGFIVSNAFAKRDFGKPLIERFFSQVNIQKVVDCSGLLFPGHGTPTCIVLGSNEKPESSSRIRLVGILPGGGDLRTPPEESPLWLTLADHHDSPGYGDARIAVADRSHGEMEKFPWSFDVGSQGLQIKLESACRNRIAEFVDSIGICFFTNAEEVFQLPPDFARRLKINVELLERCQKGEEIRDWSMSSDALTLRPYNKEWVPIDLKQYPAVAYYLRLFRKPLGDRATFSGKTYDEEGKLWYGYHIINYKKLLDTTIVSFSFISTHGHFVLESSRRLYRQTAPIIVFDKKTRVSTLTGLLNSSTALFWLKQVCFNKGAGEDEERDRFEYQGNKVEQLPVPEPIVQDLGGGSSAVGERLKQLAELCWVKGCEMPRLALQKIFEKHGEGYHDWNCNLPGYVIPHAEYRSPFKTVEDLSRIYHQAQAICDQVRFEMVAIQEEIDWLIYCSYGLLQPGDPATPLDLEPAPLDREQRPFRLWGRANGDFTRALQLIPEEWATSRANLWQARLELIRDNEHIRRLEQPVYKRRWDEQWKIGNHWRCDSIAYAAEFVDAFESWLRELAEWWLERKRDGGPVEIDEWAKDLWKDSRVQAAWSVASGEYSRLNHEKALERATENEGPVPVAITLTPDFASFKREFKCIVDKETVPENIPFAIPEEDLERRIKRKIPPSIRKIRGRLNVPRERFHLRGKTEYLWAGRQFQE